jgi:hypothetical protein
VHLVFPLGLRQEDGPFIPIRQAELSGATLHELASPDFSAVLMIAGCRASLVAAQGFSRASSLQEVLDVITALLARP